MACPTILFTGATGFIGGATAVELLLRHPNCPMLFIVRGENTKIAEARLRTSLTRFADFSLLESALQCCTTICGDLTNPMTLADPRLDQATHVLHLAANTSFRSVRSVRLTNIFGTLALAHRMRRAPGLQRFLYVGTAYICGAHPSRVVHEDDYPRSDVSHFVEYTASKAECEMLLRQTAPEIPLVIARPSVVVGHTRLGCLPSASIFWYYRALDLLRRVPVAVATRRDIVPVDYVAAALTQLLLKPGLRYRCYHVSAGDCSSVTWQEMADAFAVCTCGGSEEQYRVVDYPGLLAERHRLREQLGPGDEERFLQALELYFRFSSSGVEVFDNGRLLEEDMSPSPRFTSYLHTCVSQGPQRSVYKQMQDDD